MLNLWVRRHDRVLAKRVELWWWIHGILRLVEIGLIDLWHLDIVLVVVLTINLCSMSIDYRAWDHCMLLSCRITLLLRVEVRLRMLAGNSWLPLIHKGILLALKLHLMLLSHLWLTVIVLYQPLLLIDTCLELLKLISKLILTLELIVGRSRHRPINAVDGNWIVITDRISLILPQMLISMVILLDKLSLTNVIFWNLMMWLGGWVV
jgi:hypothetical protein